MTELKQGEQMYPQTGHDYFYIDQTFTGVRFQKVPIICRDTHTPSRSPSLSTFYFFYFVLSEVDFFKKQGVVFVNA